MDEGTKCGESLASVNYEIWRTRRRVIEKRKKDEKERKNGVNMQKEKWKNGGICWLLNMADKEKGKKGENEQRDRK